MIGKVDLFTKLNVNGCTSMAIQVYPEERSISLMYNSKHILVEMKKRLQKTSSVGNIHSQRGESVSDGLVHSYRECVMILVSTFV